MVKVMAKQCSIRTWKKTAAGGENQGRYLSIKATSAFILLLLIFG